MASERIDLEAIEALEREGFGRIINEMGRVLNQDGSEKYGVQGWRKLSYERHAEKFRRHLVAVGPDHDSGEHPRAHAMVRLAIMRELEPRHQRNP